MKSIFRELAVVTVSLIALSPGQPAVASSESKYINAVETPLATSFGQLYTASFGCASSEIPVAIAQSTEDAINKANAACPRAVIRKVRVIALNPIACRGWSAGFEPRVEVDYTCKP